MASDGPTRVGKPGGALGSAGGPREARLGSHVGRRPERRRFGPFAVATCVARGGRSGLRERTRELNLGGAGNPGPDGEDTHEFPAPRAEQAAAPRRHALGAHLAAGPAGHRRRRRHERLRRRDRPAAGRARHRGRDLHPGDVRRPARRPSSSRPGVLVRHVVAGPVRGAVEGRPARPAVRVHRRRAAGRGAPATPAGTTWCTRHYWLSGQVGWLAADRWHVPLVHTMHTMAKVKNALARRGRHPRARGPRHRRGAGRRGRRPARRQHRRARPRQLVDLYGADPAAGSRRPARRRPRRVPPGCPAAAAARARGSACRRRRGCCSSSAASSRSRPRRAAPRRRPAARRATRAGASG